MLLAILFAFKVVAQTNIFNLIDLQYADDVCWVGGNRNHRVEFFKNNIPECLGTRILMIIQIKPKSLR